MKFIISIERNNKFLYYGNGVLTWTSELKDAKIWTDFNSCKMFSLSLKITEIPEIMRLQNASI